jgi:hypothetical protein
MAHHSRDNGVLLKIGELFTDRQTEAQTFRDTLAAFRRTLDEGHGESDVDRHNVISFYGLGGIGKSALSQRLEQWVHGGLPLDSGWGPVPLTRVAATARLDLHNSVGQVDILAILLALRAGVAPLRRSWPVFDLAFAAYWSALRPGEALPSFGNSKSLEEIVSETVVDAIGDLSSLVDIVSATPTSLGVRSIRMLLQLVRRQRDLRLGIDAFPGFKKLLLRCADEPAPTDPRPDIAREIAGLLAWEIARIEPTPLVVVFIDTFERLASDPRRVSESNLNGLIHELPNILFVLTGRDFVDWADPSRVELPWRGPEIWPTLRLGAKGGPRQHLVGRLSDQDTRSIVERARSVLSLPMSDEIVAELVEASAGLPQYIDLACQVAITVKQNGTGRQVTVDDVSGSLGSLVMRVLDDVPPDEQRAIRAAALFRAFDIELVASAADVDRGCVERAVRRPMIDFHEGDRLPYRMHDAVREAIRRSDQYIPGGWSELDWERAASRAATRVRIQHDLAKQAGAPSAVLDTIGMAVTLTCEQEVALEPSPSKSYDDWLSRAIIFSPSVQGLRSRIPGSSRTIYGQAVLDFVAAKSLDTPRAERLRLLRSIFDSDHPLKLPAGRHLGYTFKNGQQWEEALHVFDELVAISPTSLNRGQRPQTLALARRFMDALDAAHGLEVETLVWRVTEYAHGQPNKYFEEVEPKLGRLREQGRQRELLEELSTYLMRRVFFRSDVSVTEVNELIAEAAEAGHTVATRTGLVAGILLRKWPRGETLTALGRLHFLDTTSTADGGIGYQWAFAECCDAILAGDVIRLESLREQVDRMPARSRAWIPIEMFLAHQGLTTRHEPTQWLESADVVRNRWFGHLARYIAEAGSAESLEPPARGEPAREPYV